MKHELLKVITGVLKLPEGTIRSDSGMHNTRGWDSLKHIEIVYEVEDRFGISLSPEEMAGCTSVQAIEEILIRKGHDGSRG